MARTHGRILTAIWADPDFAALRETEQRAFFLALSQPGLNYCGVGPYMPRRWAGFATDTTVPRIRKAFDGLQHTLFCLIDERTEEIWLRSFIRYDGILGNPNVARAAVKDFDTIHSPLIHSAVLHELHRLNTGPQEDGWEKGWSHLSELLGRPQPLPQGLPQALTQALGEHYPKWSEYARAAPTPPHLHPTTCDHGADQPSRCAFCRQARADLRANPGGAPPTQPTREAP